MATDQGSAPENGAAKQNGTASTHEVGWMFVHEYYTFLNKSPQKLHFFYKKDSSFVHGTVGDQVEAIQEKIASLEFEDCKVLVSNVDSLASIANSIIIQVLGEMSNKGLPSQRFAQTFVLAEQPNGYYVLNDVFRYLKEDDDEEEVEVAHADAQDLEHAVETLHINKTEEISHANAVDHSQLNGQDEVAAEETKEAVVAHEEPKSAEPNGVVEEPIQTVSESEVAQAKAPAVKEEKEKTTAPQPTAPKTWANLAANNQSKWGSQVSEAKGQVVSMAPGAAQAPAQTAKAHQAKSGDGKSKEHKRHKQDEAISAYVRNVTSEMTEQAIREAMSVIGPIRSVDVNCAFVEFTNEKDFKAAIALGTFEIGSHGAVIAEERRRQTPHNRDGRNRFERPQAEKRGNGFQRDAKRGKTNGEQPKKKANDKNLAFLSHAAEFFGAMEAVGTEAPFGVVEALDERLDAVQEQLKSLLKRPLSETVPKLSHVDRSKLFVMLSYTINTLVFVYLKTQGHDPKTHPVVRELERVRDYIEKIKTATGKKTKPSMTVDQAASKRTISAALAANRIQDKGKTSTLSTPTPSPPSTPNSQSDVKKRPADAGKFHCTAAGKLGFTLVFTLDVEPTTHKKNKKWEKEKPKTSKKSRLPITGVSYE